MIKHAASKRRLYYLVTFVVIITAFTFVLSLYTSYKIRGLFVNNSKKLLENNIFLLKETVDQFYWQTLENVSANFNLFHINIYNNGSFTLDTSNKIKQSVLNQTTSIEKEVDLPVMMYNGKPVLNNFALVDKIVDTVNIQGLTTTIFQTIDNGILRITTNVMNKSGERAVGTYIPSDSIVYRTVMAGNIYRGRAYVVNQWYWSVYEPIFSDGKVIGVLYMGIKETSLLKVLQKTFESVKIGVSGYPFLMDSEGFLIIHPFNEGENLRNVATSDGKILYRIMRKNRQGWVKYEYPKPGDMKAYKKLTRYTTIDGLGWVVGAGVYEDEFYTDFAQYEIVYGIVIILIMLITGGIVAVNIFNTNRKLIDQSLQLQKLAVDAENANVAKSAFLANMSHEIRTPLNSIMGFSDLLKASSLLPQEKEFADTISQSAKTLLSIINDILDISKIESGKIELTSEEFELQQILDNVIKMISVKAKQKDISFYYYYDTDLPKYIMGDPVRLQQVLTNLLSNAVKFTNNNGEINLSLHMLYKGTDEVSIKYSISDTGIGIPPSSIDKVFEPFNQADSGISRKYGGTGLGLTICSKLVEMMGSKIKVASVQSKGTTFSFTLPLKVPADYVDAKTKKFGAKCFCIAGSKTDFNNTKSMVISYLRGLGEINFYEENNKCSCDLVFCFSPEEVRNYYSGVDRKLYDIPVVYVGEEKYLNPDTLGLVNYIVDHPVYLSKIYNVVVQACGISDMYDHNQMSDIKYNGHVLVAEDNRTNQLLMKILLEKYGLNVAFVEDGQKAVEYCMRHKPDLILMDINMPVMDGVTAYFEIKKYCTKEKIPMIPVVALTANAVKGDREKYLDTGMADYLSKPIENSELHRVLSFYLKAVSDFTVTNPEVKTKITSSGTYDKQKSIEKIGISEKDYDMILDQLFSNLDQDMKMLEDAVKAKNIDSIYSILHYLKGASVNLHITSVTGLLEEYTEMAKSGVVSGYDTDKIRERFEEVRRLINSE